jgi:hypothetical protein
MAVQIFQDNIHDPISINHRQSPFTKMAAIEHEFNKRAAVEVRGLPAKVSVEVFKQKILPREVQSTMVGLVGGPGNGMRIFLKSPNDATFAIRALQGQLFESKPIRATIAPTDACLYLGNLAPNASRLDLLPLLKNMVIFTAV